jgi:hypothetical protein
MRRFHRSSEGAGFTIIVPALLDSPERAENLAAILRFVARAAPGASIVVQEQSPSGAIHAPDGVLHRRLDLGGVFHKARLVNRAIAAATTPFLVIQDADVLVADSELQRALDAVRSGADLVVAHSGLVLELEQEDRRLALGRAEAPAMGAGGRRVLATRARGGIVAARRACLVRAGLLCERFVGWGPEDVELVERVEKLGGIVQFGDGPAWHLSHPRGPGSLPHHPWFAANVAELGRLRSLTVSELARDVRSWPWLEGDETDQ